MKEIALVAAAIIYFFALTSCETIGFAPPPVTVELARTGARQHVDTATLREGRGLFVSRCIECHALPEIAQHTAPEWPRVIDEMAGRASLKPAERNAVLAYILAARAQ